MEKATIRVHPEVTKFLDCMSEVQDGISTLPFTFLKVDGDIWDFAPRLTPEIGKKDLERLLQDSRGSTVTELDELSFIRLVLRCLISGLSYEEALQCCHAQLSDQINGE